MRSTIETESLCTFEKCVHCTLAADEWKFEFYFYHSNAMIHWQSVIKTSCRPGLEFKWIYWEQKKKTILEFHWNNEQDISHKEFSRSNDGNSSFLNSKKKKTNKRKKSVKQSIIISAQFVKLSRSGMASENIRKWLKWIGCHFVHDLFVQQKTRSECGEERTTSCTRSNMYNEHSELWMEFFSKLNWLMLVKSIVEENL